MGGQHTPLTHPPPHRTDTTEVILNANIMAETLWEGKSTDFAELSNPSPDGQGPNDEPRFGIYFPDAGCVWNLCFCLFRSSVLHVCLCIYVCVIYPTFTPTIAPYTGRGGRNCLLGVVYSDVTDEWLRHTASTGRQAAPTTE